MTAFVRVRISVVDHVPYLNLARERGKKYTPIRYLLMLMVAYSSDDNSLFVMTTGSSCHRFILCVCLCYWGDVLLPHFSRRVLCRWLYSLWKSVMFWAIIRSFLLAYALGLGRLARSIRGRESTYRLVTNLRNCLSWTIIYSSSLNWSIHKKTSAHRWTGSIP